MKNITNIFTILFLSLFSIATMMGQNPAFVYLPDMTGYSLEDSPQNLKDDLKEAADSLRAALPQAYQSDFAVYDMGFYTHHAAMTGGVQKVIADAISDRITHSYYLLFGREMDREGRIKKVWVEVELPEEEWLLDCFNQTYIDVVKARVRNKADEAFNQNTPQITAGIQTISYFADEIKKLADCCDPLSSFRQQECQECQSSKEIFDWLMDHDFVGKEVSNITYGVPDNSFNNIVDHAGVFVNGVSLAQLVNETIGNIASIHNTSATGYITNNSSFCNGIADIVLVDYAADLGNFDVWVHLWDDTLNNVQIIFVRADFYILYDDPSFIEYYSQSNDPALQSLAGRSQDPEKAYLIFDPENNLYYYSEEIVPLPPSFDDAIDRLITLTSHPTHKVRLGDNLTKIVEEWGYGFTISDLIEWNSDKLVDENTVLQIGWELKIYNDAFKDKWIDEFYVWGYTIPIQPLKDYNLIPRTAHPDLGFVPLGAPVQNFRTPVRINPTITISNPNGRPPFIKTQGRWDILKRFVDKNGKIFLRVGSGGILVLLEAFFTPYTANPNPGPFYYSPPMVFIRKIDEEERDNKLTYVTYTKYNEKIKNESPLPDGKVYIGRSSGYNKNPLIIIRLREYGHHKSFQDYEKACYDHHEYSTTNLRANRHQDPAYKIIRGREQVVLESLGGAWSDVRKQGKTVTATRSGNEINGIDRVKFPSFYWECKNLALKIQPLGSPKQPSINWIPLCEYWQEY